MECPRCYAYQKQYKTGFNPSGIQRYRCVVCNLVYTPQPKPRGYSSDTRMLALRLYVEGNSLRAIGRILKINQQTVANWISDYVNQLPSAPMPEKPQDVESDELYTFLEKKKNEIYIPTIVDRATHCVLSWDVVYERTSANLQACLERAPQAKKYYSDALHVYDTLYYGAPYVMRTDKNETHSIGAVNADLRHYLKRLARKSRCISRRSEALHKNVRLFAYCYNQRQMMKRLYPKYSFHLIDFLCPVS